MNTLLIRSQFRFALRHPIGALTSLVGVTVAVTAVVAVHLLGQSLRLGLETTADAALSGYTHVATRAGLRDADYFRLRRQWRQGDPALAAVQAMMPVLDDYVAVGNETPQRSVFRLIGVDPLAGGEAFAGESAWPTGMDADDIAPRFLVDDVIVANRQAARTLRTDGGKINGFAVTVVETDADGALLADLPTAQRLLGRAEELDAIWLRITGVRSRWLTWLDALLPGIAAALPDYSTPTLDGYAVSAERRWNPLRRFTDASVFNLGMLTMLSVLMAAFLAVQASFANAARRRDERQRLVALGVSNKRLRALAAGEGLLLGSIGAGLGIALGHGVAVLLLEATGSAESLAIPAPQLDGWVVGKALFCGSVVASIGALFAGRERRPRPRIGIVAALVAAAATVLCLVHGELGDGSLPSVFVALLAAVGVQILVIVPLAGGAVRELTTRYGFGSLATRASLRGAAARIGEIRLALGALSVAIAVALGMGLMVESLRRDFSSMLDQRLWSGVHLSAEAEDADFDVKWIRQLPGVRDVRRYGEFDARLAQGRIRVDVARLDALETARYGFAGELTERALLNEVGGRLLGIEAGDTVTVSAAGASVSVEVAHIFRDFGAAQPRLLIPMPLHRPFGDLVAWRQLWVLAEDGDTARLSAALGTRYRASRITDQTRMRRAAMGVFDRSFAVSRGLTVVALAVAAVGLYAALTALLAARRHEFLLWAALGCSRNEIWRQAMTQTLLLGTVAVFAALPFGIFIAWVLCAFVNPLAFGWSIDLHLHAGAMGYPLLLGLGVTLLAGATPAYRFARATGNG